MTERCVLVLAREGDPALARLAALAPGRVRHVRPRDLSRPGWRYVAGEPEEARAVADGEVLAAADVGGVLCRIGALVEADLPHIHPADRAYVAAEMNAFLLAWLSQFRGARGAEPVPYELWGRGGDAALDSQAELRWLS